MPQFVPTLYEARQLLRKAYLELDKPLPLAEESFFTSIENRDHLRGALLSLQNATPGGKRAFIEGIPGLHLGEDRQLVAARIQTRLFDKLWQVEKATAKQADAEDELITAIPQGETFGIDIVKPLYNTHVLPTLEGKQGLLYVIKEDPAINQASYLAMLKAVVEDRDFVGATPAEANYVNDLKKLLMPHSLAAFVNLGHTTIKNLRSFIIQRLIFEIRQYQPDYVANFNPLRSQLPVHPLFDNPIPGCNAKLTMLRDGLGHWQHYRQLNNLPAMSAVEEQNHRLIIGDQLWLIQMFYQTAGYWENYIHQQLVQNVIQAPQFPADYENSVVQEAYRLNIAVPPELLEKIASHAAQQAIIPPVNPPVVAQPIPAAVPAEVVLPDELQRYHLAQAGKYSPLVNCLSLNLSSAITRDLLDHRVEPIFQEFLQCFKEFHPYFEPPTFATLKEWFKYYSSANDIEAILYPVLNQFLLKQITGDVQASYQELFHNQVAHYLKAVSEGTPIARVMADSDNAFAHLKLEDGQLFLQQLLSDQQFRSLAPAGGTHQVYKASIEESVRALWPKIWENYQLGLQTNQHIWNLHDCKIIAQALNMKLRVWNGRQLNELVPSTSSLQMTLAKKDNAYQVFLVSDTLAQAANQRDASQDKHLFLDQLDNYYDKTLALPAPPLAEQSSVANNSTSKITTIKTSQMENLQAWADKFKFTCTKKANQFSVALRLDDNTSLDIDVTGNKVILNQTIKNLSEPQKFTLAKQMLEAYILSQYTGVIPNDGSLPAKAANKPYDPAIYFNAEGELAKYLNALAPKMGLTPASMLVEKAPGTQQPAAMPEDEIPVPPNLTR